MPIVLRVIEKNSIQLAATGDRYWSDRLYIGLSAATKP